MPENAPATVGWPGQAWRIARRNSVARFSEIRPEDALLPNSGNRFDVSGVGVLYAASEPAADTVGEPMYAGIRYMSRLDSGWECWALFDPETVDVGAGEAIAIDDVTLQATARAFNLTVF